MKPAAASGPEAVPGDAIVRCPWALGHPLLLRYHDEEWGFPLRSPSAIAATAEEAREKGDGTMERRLFEFLLLESFQAGLSWLCVLKKREAFRKAFANFEPAKVARYGKADEERLAQDAGIVRNKLKIAAAIGNAGAFLRVQAEEGSFERYLWSWVAGEPIVNRFRTPAEMPAKTPLAEELSADLQRRGFKFVGPVIVYSLMQAIGMVNDHMLVCHRHAECEISG